MIVHFPTKQDGCELLVDGVATVFSYAPNGIKVSMHISYTLFESYGNSWGTMDTLQTPGTSAAKETSLPVASE